MALRLSTGLRNKLLGTASFTSIMQNGVIRIFPGVQPTTADDAESARICLRSPYPRVPSPPGRPPTA